MIRLANKQDLEKILTIYQDAKKIMIEIGNTTQWNSNYPSSELLLNDIEKKQLYIIQRDDNVCGVFAFIIGEDETYKKINGSWLQNNQYGTIHRIAGLKDVSGIFKESLQFCQKYNNSKEVTSKISSLRIDTHKNNSIMKHLVEKNGFTYCGIIHLQDGSERIAFEKLV